ncbi:peptide ABC transporter substrate-binding protein [Paraphotobacterium marinum]|uniref:peptide ABC transporter substrate-binding protein n=1 Tax=Paraphotobacterium marinum TaxID=1755811 RepID=UPI0039EB2C3D
MAKKNFFKKILVTSSIFLTISSNAFASDKPENVQLAQKQEVTLGMGSESNSYDPNLCSTHECTIVLVNLFETLTQIGKDGKPEPAAAKSWDISSDHKVYTFHIRKDANWSDGKPVTAEDFVYSWQRLVAPQTSSEYSYFLGLGNVLNADDIMNGKKKPSELGVKALDQKTFQVTLSKPTPFFISMTSQINLAPLPKEIVEKFKSKWVKAQNIVSNGAYTLSEHVLNEKFVLKKNPKYWDSKNVHITKATFLPLVESSEYKLYAADNLDMTYTVPVDLISKIKQEYNDQFRATPGLKVTYFGINVKKPALDKVDVRKAITIAINRDAIAKQLLNGAALPAYSLVPNNVDNYKPFKPDYASWSQEKRIQVANELLKKAGYNQQNPATINLLYNTADVNQKLAVAIQAMLQQSLPVKVKLDQMEWKSMLAQRSQRDYGLLRMTWIGDFNDPSTFLANWTTGNAQNDAQWSNKDYDNLFAKSFETEDQEKRKDLFYKMSELIAKDVPAMPVFYGLNTHLIKPDLKGVMSNPLDIYYVKDMYKVKTN